MELVTNKDCIKNVAKNWQNFYRNLDGSWREKEGGRIMKELLALGISPKQEDIEKIIGNRSFTTVYCEECGKFYNEVLKIDGYMESSSLCKKCLEKALALFKPIFPAGYNPTVRKSK